MLKITDFGTSKQFDNHPRPFTFLGTPAWLAPEVIRAEDASEKVDIWSYGVLLWELLTCEIPYRGLEPASIIFGIGSAKLSLPGMSC